MTTEADISQEDPKIPSENLSITKKHKSYVIAYAIWLVLGIIGGHRYYLDKRFSGFLYTITFGFLLYGWIIDIILLYGMVRNYNRTEHNQPKNNFFKLMTSTQEIAPWAQDKPKNIFSKFLNQVDNIFRIFVFLIFPPLSIVVAYYFELAQLIGFLLVVLIITGYLGSIEKTLGSIDKAFQNHIILVKIPFLFEILDLFKDFYNFYRDHKPHNPLGYIFYPIFGVFGLIFSKNTRKEFNLFKKIIVLILIALVIKILFNFWEDFFPYLGIDSAILLIIVMPAILFMMITMFLMPTVSTSFYLKLSGRNGLNRTLATIGIVLSIVTYIQMLQSRELSLFARARLDEKMQVEAFQKDLQAASDMFLSYYVKQILEEDDNKNQVFLDKNLSNMYQQHLESVLPRRETRAFYILKVASQQENNMLAVSYDSNQGYVLLFAIDEQRTIYHSWEQLPENIKEKFVLKENYHIYENLEEKVYGSQNLPAYVIEQHWLISEYINFIHMQKKIAKEQN